MLKAQLISGIITVFLTLSSSLGGHSASLMSCRSDGKLQVSTMTSLTDLHDVAYLNLPSGGGYRLVDTCSDFEYTCDIIIIRGYQRLFNWIFSLKM